MSIRDFIPAWSVVRQLRGDDRLALVLAGAALERWAVYKAGFQSARDPRYTVIPQRERLRERDGAAGDSGGEGLR